MEEELKFKIQRLGTTIAATDGVLIEPTRFLVNEVAGSIEVLLHIAVQEHDSFEYPATWWDYTKIKLLPKWLLRRFPATFNRVYTQHKFPEVDVSNVGKEFVSFKIIPETRIYKE